MKRRIPLQQAVAIEIILLFTIAAFFMPGGEDLHVYYRPFAQGCLECGFNPWHASLMLFPLGLIPPRLLWPAAAGLTGLTIYWACRKLGTNPVTVLLSFPAMGVIWLGQVDAVIIAGLVLALLSNKPGVRGAGLLLASIKPQVAGPAILLLLILDHQRLKTLIIPTAAFLVTALLWGVDWPLRWLSQGVSPPDHVWQLATLYPYGLAAFLALLPFRDKRKLLTVTLLASALGIPWFSAYSHIVFLVLFAPWWAVPVSYTWFIAYPFFGNTALRFAWVLPLSILVSMLVGHFMSRQKEKAAQRFSSGSPA